MINLHFCLQQNFFRNTSNVGGEKWILLSSLLASHNSSFLYPLFLLLLVVVFFFLMPVTDPRCQMAAAADCMADPLGCSWVSTPGLILAVSYRWSADYFSELSCSSNASRFFLPFSYSGNTWGLKIHSWRNLSCIVYKVCGSKRWPCVHYSFYIAKWFN